MASPATDGLVKCSFNYTWNGEQCQNVFHVATPIDPITFPMLDALVAQLLTSWETNIRPQQTNTLTLRTIEAETYGGPINSMVFELNVNLAGDLTEESVPNNVALCVSFRTGLTGRARRGRVYTPGAVLEHLNNTFFTQGYADALVSAWDDLHDELVLIGWTPVIASLISGGAPRAEPLVTPITSVVVTDLAVDSMRRRLPGRGF